VEVFWRITGENDQSQMRKLMQYKRGEKEKMSLRREALWYLLFSALKNKKVR
jgi:hypothetical protein